MNYEDDELERMRARREQQRRSRGNVQGGSSVRPAASKASGTRASGSGDSFKSGYNGPKGGQGSPAGSPTGSRQQRPLNKRRKGAEKKKRMIIIAAEIAILLVLVVGAAGWYIYERTFGSMQKINFNEKEVENLNLSDEQLASMKGYMTVACFGVDSRSVSGKQNVGRGTNADVNLICNVNMDTGEIRLVSVFRDTYLNINDKNSYNKINAAYASGGPEQAVKALNKNLGLNMTQYATFNWKAVADAINILDGVDIELSENELSWINAFITETVKETGIGSVQLKKSGLVHMDGVQAVAYGRLRYGDTDYARTERQRIVLQKAFDKAKNANWATLNNVIQTVMPQLATNVSIPDLLPMARNIKKFHIGETSGFPSARGESTVGKLGDCVVPQTLETNVNELHKFLFDTEDYEVPANVKEYSQHISDATGMYKEGKHIGHVPVDEGVSARSYVAKKQQRADDAAAAKSTKAASTEETTESSTESTAESSTSESTKESSTSESDDWDDEEWETDVEWDDGEWNQGPGSTGPGASTRPTQEPIRRPGEKQTDPEETASGPGKSTTETTSSNRNNSPTSGIVSPDSGVTSPGGSDRTNNSNSGPGTVPAGPGA